MCWIMQEATGVFFLSPDTSSYLLQHFWVIVQSRVVLVYVDDKCKMVYGGGDIDLGSLSVLCSGM